MVVGLLLILTLAAFTMGLIAQPDPLTATATVLLGIGLWVLGTSSVVGIMVTRSRWAYLTGWAVITTCVALLIVRPIDVFWVVSLVLATAGAAGLIGVGVRSLVRTRPSASGPPNAAVGVGLSMAALPLVLGLTAYSSAGWLELGVGITGPLASLWFIKTLPGALILTRILWPVAMIVAAPWMEPVSMVVVVLVAVITSLAAWRPEVRTSVRPLTTTGSRIRIPPELAPRDVLDSAGIDERGRPK